MEAITIASIIESSSKTKGRQLSDKEIPCIICDEVSFNNENFTKILFCTY